MFETFVLSPLQLQSPTEKLFRVGYLTSPAVNTSRSIEVLKNERHSLPE